MSRRIQRLSGALQKLIEAELDEGASAHEVAVIVAELAIRYAHDDQLTAYATLTGIGEAVRDALGKARS